MYTSKTYKTSGEIGSLSRVSIKLNEAPTAIVASANGPSRLGAPWNSNNLNGGDGGVCVCMRECVRACMNVCVRA